MSLIESLVKWMKVHFHMLDSVLGMAQERVLVLLDGCVVVPDRSTIEPKSGEPALPAESNVHGEER